MAEMIGIVGAGQMGAGIAQVFAASGYSALLYDKDQAALSRGVQGVENQLKKLVEKQKITAEAAAATRKGIEPQSSLQALSKCALIIEAIIENFDIKAALFKELAAICPSSTVLASNTSSISITKMAAGVPQPERFIGLHFMNPVPVMQLVEIIRGLQTSDDTYTRMNALMQKIGKTTVLGIDSPGFIVNRILVPMINEAIYVLQEGVKPEDIDNAMKLGTNQPMGPLQLADFVGLDTLLSILKLLHRELGEDKYRPCPLLIRYVEAGWYGRKNGRGFYRYA